MIFLKIIFEIYIFKKLCDFVYDKSLVINIILINIKITLLVYEKRV